MPIESQATETSMRRDQMACTIPLWMQQCLNKKKVQFAVYIYTQMVSCPLHIPMDGKPETGTLTNHTSMLPSCKSTTDHQRRPRIPQLLPDKGVLLEFDMSLHLVWTSGSGACKTQHSPPRAFFVFIFTSLKSAMHTFDPLSLFQSLALSLASQSLFIVALGHITFITLHSPIITTACKGLSIFQSRNP